MMLGWTKLSRCCIQRASLPLLSLFAIASITARWITSTSASTAKALAYLIDLLVADRDHSNCESLFNHGRWTSRIFDDPHNKWQPFDCFMQRYDLSATSKCLQGRTLYFIGDSNARLLLWAVAGKLEKGHINGARVHSEKHVDFTYEASGVRLQFLWDPYLNSSKSMSALEKTLPTYNNEIALNESPRGIVVSIGLWHARYLEKHYISEYDAALSRLSPFLLDLGVESKVKAGSDAVEHSHIPILLQPPPLPTYGLLTPERAATLTEHRMAILLKRLRYFQDKHSIEIPWSNLLMTSEHPLLLLDSGIHVPAHVASQQADILLNRLCNSALQHASPTYQPTCCTTPGRKHHPTWQSWILMTVLWLFHLQITWTASRFKDRVERFQHASVPVLFTAGVLYCYCTDRVGITNITGKSVSATAFVTTVALSIIIASEHARRHARTSVKYQNVRTGVGHGFLSRQQTEEWKGWMQIVILLYHYFGMSKVLWAYQIVRVLVGSYLFLTGFGHSSYFIRTGDFSLHRLVTVLYRLNILAVCLSFMMNNAYQFYYFPSLSSFWFFTTYATFYDKSIHRSTMSMLLTRFLSSIGLMMILMKCNLGIGWLFSQFEKVGGPKFDPIELSFRASLDMYAPFMGMLVAIIYCRWDSFAFQKSPTRWISTFPDNLRIIASIASVIIIIAYFVLARLFHDKLSYNEWHSLISLIPMLAYIQLRNCSKLVQQYHFPLFTWVGGCSLETFLLQYHIWLAADTKGILRLGIFDHPGWGGTITLLSWTWWADTILATVLFLWISSSMAKMSDIMTKAFAGENNRSAPEMGVLPATKLELAKRPLLEDFTDQGLACRSVIVLIVLWMLKTSFHHVESI